MELLRNELVQAVLIPIIAPVVVIGAVTIVKWIVKQFDKL